MKILQINTTVNSGSTGRIAEDIGKLLLARGHESLIAYGRNPRPSASRLFPIGTRVDTLLHILASRLADRHGFASKRATSRFISQFRTEAPDLIHLHNIHGYYLNVDLLFNYLKSSGIPVVWTFHDCWPFTGHCSYFDRVNCTKWQDHCGDCPNLQGYPTSWLIDGSARNFLRKRELFSPFKNLTIVTPSQWLADHVGRSFLRGYPRRVIHNGIRLDVFKPAEDSAISAVRSKYGLETRQVVLGVASLWDWRKGLDDLVALQQRLGPDRAVVLVGVSDRQKKTLPAGMVGIARTEDTLELAALYSAAAVFVNPTHVDNFPTTNIEALACGTPVITYDTGGSPESLDAEIGRVVAKGDVNGLAQAVEEILAAGKDRFRTPCRRRAEALFDSNERYADYLKLYEEILGGQ